MTAASVLDDKTASAIREALAAASFGRLADACAIGERALREGGDAAALQAMLGMLKTRMGDLDAAVGHLTMAHAQRPADVLIANNLATALARLERHRDALNVVSDE
jgi:Flp pilus assembly protein TadD